MHESVPRYFLFLSGFALLCSLARGWLMPLFSGFYLDETGTLYMISGSWSDFTDRMSATIQSPLYMTFLWLWSRVAGFSEAALRLPSVLAAIASAYFLYRFAARLADRQAAIAAAVVLFSAGLFVQQTFQARPYAFCVLGSLLAISSLFTWLEIRTWKATLQTSLYLSVLLYLQPLNVSIMAVVGLLIALYHAREEHLPLRQAGAILGLPVLLALPILPYYGGAAREASSYVFSNRPALDHFVNVYGEVVSVGAFLFGFLAAALLAPRFRFAAYPLHPFSAILITVWALVPPLAIFAYSRLQWPVYSLRYYSVAFPAIALALALLLRLASPSFAHAVALTVFSLSSTAAIWSTSFWPQTIEWKEAAAVLRGLAYPPDTPVLVGSGFTEAKSIRRIEDPRTRPFLLAPAYAYRVPGELHPIPYSPGEGGGYLNRLLPAIVRKRPRAFVMSSDPAWHAWFAANCRATWRVERLHPFVTELSKPVVTLKR